MDTLEVKLEKLVGCINARNQRKRESIDIRYAKAIEKLFGLSERVRKLIHVGGLVDTVSNDYGDCSYNHYGSLGKDYLTFHYDGNDSGEFSGIGLSLLDDDAFNGSYIVFDGYLIYGEIENIDVRNIFPIEYAALHPAKVLNGVKDNERRFGKYVNLLEKFVELYPEFEETVHKDACALMNEYKDEFEV